MIPTAGEFLESMNIPPDATWGMFDIDKIMIEFAKLHVEAALKAASEKASMQIEETMSSVRYISHSQGDQTLIVAKDSILNAYPKELIK